MLETKKETEHDINSNKKEKLSEKAIYENYVRAIEPYLCNIEINLKRTNTPPDYNHILSIFSTIVPFFVFYKKKNEIRSAVIGEINVKDPSSGKATNIVSQIKVKVRSIHTGNSIIDCSQNIIESLSSLQNCLTIRRKDYKLIKNREDLDKKIKRISTNYKDLKYISRDGRIINLHVLLYNEFLNLKMYCCSPFPKDGKYYFTIEGLLPSPYSDDIDWIEIIKRLDSEQSLSNGNNETDLKSLKNLNGYLQSNKFKENHQSSNDSHNVIKENMNGNKQINRTNEYLQSSGINNDLVRSNSNDKHDVVNGYLNTNGINKNIESNGRVDISNSNDNHNVDKENTNGILLTNGIKKKRKSNGGINKKRSRIQINDSELIGEQKQSKSIHVENEEKILLFYLKSNGKKVKRPKNKSLPFDIVMSNNIPFTKHDVVTINDEHIDLIEVKSETIDEEQKFDSFILTESELKCMLEYYRRYKIYIIGIDKSKCPINLYKCNFDENVCKEVNSNIKHLEDTGVVPDSFKIKFCDEKMKEIKEFKDWLNKDMNEEDRKLFKRIFKRECNESKIVDELKKVLSGYE